MKRGGWETGKEPKAFLKYYPAKFDIKKNGCYEVSEPIILVIVFFSHAMLRCGKINAINLLQFR